jgi:hypothetical protein
MWQERYGHATGGVPPVMQMPLAEAIALLAALGTSAPAPKMPAYYPSGTRVVYRSGRRRLGHTRQRISHTRRLTG